jgi:DNA-binding transcriptional LysR family regulator
MEEMHFGRAAERIHISQPPLSQAIRKLESELGVQLLDRTSRAVAPTKAGRVFALEARKVLASFERAIEEARRAAGAGAAIRVGCTPCLPVASLQRFVTALGDRCETASARVTHLLAGDQVTRLLCGELDFAIFSGVEDHPDTISEPLFRGAPLAAHLPRDHELTEKPVLTPTDLEGEHVVMTPRAANPAFFDRVLAEAAAAGYRFRGVREASGGNPRDLALAVAGGLGVALQPLSFTEVGQAGTLVANRAIDPPVFMPDTVIAWRADPARGLRPVISAVRDIARELHRDGDDGV